MWKCHNPTLLFMRKTNCVWLFWTSHRNIKILLESRWEQLGDLPIIQSDHRWTWCLFLDLNSQYEQGGKRENSHRSLNLNVCFYWKVSKCFVIWNSLLLPVVWKIWSGERREHCVTSHHDLWAVIRWAGKLLRKTVC